ncbi:MAG: hypothetical protein JW909_13010 [Planctomycetes bacterium]|nr:hypothetical protein [Planctomycetota bacterium]
MDRVMAFLFVVSACAGALAGEYVYENIGMGGGGGIFTPAISPVDPKFMLCSSDMSGCYRTYDGGQSWRMTSFHDISGAIGCRPYFHPTNVNVVVWKDRITTDKAQSWKPMARGAAPWQGGLTHVACFGENPLVLFAGNGSGVWASYDGGASWKQAASGPCGGIAVLDDGTVFAAAGPALYRWRVGAGDPAPVTMQGVSGDVAALAAGGTNQAHTVHVVAGGSVYTSSDSCATWRNTRSGGIADVVMAPSRREAAYCCDRMNIYVTSDAGASWKSCFDLASNVEQSWVQTELRWSYYVVKNGLGVCPSDPSIAIMSTQGDIYATADSGKSWKQLMNRRVGSAPGGPGGRYQPIGLEVTTCWDYLFDPHNPNRHYIAYTDIGFAYSTDKGKTWSYGGRGSPWANTFYGVVFDPHVPGKMYAACSSKHDIPHWTHCNADYKPGGVCVSDDWGVTWKPVSAGLPRLPACGIAVDPGSKPGAVTLYATMYGDGVYKSTDGGQSWVKKPGVGRPGNYHVYQVRIHEKSGAVYVNVGANRKDRVFSPHGGLWKSSDGGDTWTEITASVKLVWPNGFAVHPDNPNIIYLVAGTTPAEKQGGVYKTLDGGQSWKHIFTDGDMPGYCHGMFVELHPDDPDVVYFGGTRGLYASPDAGAHWRLLDEIPFAICHRTRIDPNDKKTMYVTTFGGGVWRGPVLRGLPVEKPAPGAPVDPEVVQITAVPVDPGGRPGRILRPPHPAAPPEPLGPSPQELRAAADAAERKLRQDVIRAVQDGAAKTVSVDYMGAAMRASVKSADDAGLTVAIAGVQVKIPWGDLSPARFAGIASRYSGDADAISAFRLGRGLDE